ncbi:hypothetical protein [[Clostridium] fimetarium]|uniref:Uncharacterized protein n=1 Tax=[Clostridium] fimetarium TaxID=99656 RepID=A0A1I0QS44_9FIRM|nr:hypothetical protein [[Clostridium] fimetarium]SEW30417.1 hypothetical protein SAMN05421659_10952 [[Clostridium] fimetarium]
MRGKSWLKYLVYAVLVAAMVMLSAYIEEKFIRGRLSDWRYPMACMVICITIGLLLGGEYLLKEIKKGGRWGIDFPKLILVGLPALYFSIANFGFASDSPLWSNMIKNVSYTVCEVCGIVSYWTGYVRIFQVILGYIIITSFYKRTKDDLHNQIPTSNFKSWLRYLVNIVLIVIVVFLRERTESAIVSGNHMRQMDGKYIIYGMVMCIAIGFLLGGENLFIEIKKQGKWKINLPKVILLGLPALYISLAALGYIPIHWLATIYNSPIGVIFHPWTVICMNICYAEYITLIEVILGYVIITSFYKFSKNGLTHNQ